MDFILSLSDKYKYIKLKSNNMGILFDFGATLFAVGVLGGFILIKFLRIRDNISNAVIGAMVIIGLLLMLLFAK